MSSNSILNENTKSTSLPADVTDDSCIFKYAEIAPITRDTDGACTTECDSGDWSVQVKQQNLPVVNQVPQDVCSTDFYSSRSLLLTCDKCKIILFSFVT